MQPLIDAQDVANAQSVFWPQSSKAPASAGGDGALEVAQATVRERGIVTTRQEGGGHKVAQATVASRDSADSSK